MSGRAVPTCWLVLAVAATALHGQGWVGQEWLSRRDSTADITAFVAVDRSGRPWAVWLGWSGDTSLMCSAWLGDRWDQERGVGPDAPGLYSRPAPSLCVDGQNRVWFAWTNLWPNNTCDVATRFWAGDSWSREIPVNRPDTGESDDSPWIAYGGGKLWCVWEGFPDTLSMRYSTFASCWDDGLEAWGPEMQVSPPDGNMHWWSKVAVDSQGRPHVVWSAVPLYTVLYSFYDGNRWVGPFPVNDTNQVTASWLAAPRIAIDRQGVLHACFTGATRGALHRDIFYSRNSGDGWRPCEKVSRDACHDEWYSDVAADRPDNVWVVWDRQGEGQDQFRVYASRRDSTGWSLEERLDNNLAYYDGYPHVALDTNGCPWVVWYGITNDRVNFDIFFNRYLAPGAVQQHPVEPPGRRLALSACVTEVGCVRFCCETPTPGPVRLDIYDRLGRRVATIEATQAAAGQLAIDWRGCCLDGKRAPAGTYFCRLSAAGMEERCSFVLLHD